MLFVKVRKYTKVFSFFLADVRKYVYLCTVIKKQS